jgi:UrcA family protein
MRLIRSLALGALAVTAAGGPSTALADSMPPLAPAHYDRVTFRVHFDRTDLSEPGKAAALHRRIQVAAARSCEDSAGVDWMLSRRYRCIRDAVENAVTQIGEPQLTAVHRQWGPHDSSIREFQ